MIRQKQEIIISAQSPLRQMRGFFSLMLLELRGAWALGWTLFQRDFRTQYRQTFLGVFWAIVPVLGLATPFILARSAQILQISPPDVPYPVFVTMGLVLWQAFSSFIGVPNSAFGEYKGIMAKVRLAPEAPIIAKSLEALINLLLRWLLLFVFFYIFDVPVRAGLLLMPIALIPFAVLGLAVGFFVNVLGNLNHDFGRAWGFGITIWMFLTPVVYVQTSMGWLSRLNRLNPLTYLFDIVRHSAQSGLGDWFGYLAPIGVWTLVALVLLLPTWILFRIAVPHLIDRGA